MKKHTSSYYLRFLVIICSAVFSADYLSGHALLAGQGDIYKSLDVLSDVISIVESDYIDKVSPEKLLHGALRGALRSLDGYSCFDPDPEKGGETAGKPEAEVLDTYGLEVAYKNSILTVIAPVEGSPAWKAGLKADDKIIKIDEEPVGESSLSELLKRFRGRAGEQLQLKVLRRGAPDFLDFTVEPGKIEAPEARQELMEDGIGLLRVTRFETGTAERTSACLEKLKKEGADSLIIDLRDCPGGDIESAVAVADLLLPEGELITSLKGRAEGVSREFRSKGKPVLAVGGPMVLLMSGGTSGAAEVLAGALRHSRKAVIMGQKSFGSAYKESSFTIGDGSRITLITGVYLTPGGKKIQGEGIEVDIQIEPPPPPQEDKEIEQEDKKNEEDGEKRTDKDTSDEGKRDPMIQSAIDLIKGIRIISAGGRA